MPNKCVRVDFLTGESDSGCERFRRGAVSFRDALGMLCWKHRTTPAVFRRLEVVYYGDEARFSSWHYVLNIEDEAGRFCMDEYDGNGRRFVSCTASGLVRKKRGVVQRRGASAGD